MAKEMTLSRLLESAMDLDEGTRFPVGTVRTWNRGGKPVEMKKVGHKEWVPVSKTERQSAKEFSSAKDRLGSLFGKKSIEIDGQSVDLSPDLTSKSADEHEAIAREFLGKHDGVLEENMDMLRDMFPEAQVYGRVKTVPSALTKLVRKPKHFLSEDSDNAWLGLLQEGSGRRTKGYGTARDLDDGGGMRAVFATVQQVQAAVKKLKSQLGLCRPGDDGPCIVSEDDYLGDANPPNKNYPYRSYHMVVRRNGLNQEIQLRTKNQDRWGDWYHDAYKPRTAEQKAFFAKNKAMVNDYAREVSDYFKAIESGKKAKKPGCHEAIRKMFGCL